MNTFTIFETVYFVVGFVVVGYLIFRKNKELMSNVEYASTKFHVTTNMESCIDAIMHQCKQEDISVNQYIKRGYTPFDPTN